MIDRRRARRARTRARLVPLFALVALAVLVATALAACGGGVEGTYELTQGEDVMESFTLTLDGGEFALAGPNPMGGEDVEFTGKYTVDGDKISLDMEGEESEVGTINGERLEFESIVWTKE
jgi:predicted small secreted protein